jgi:hypothetical protein
MILLKSDYEDWKYCLIILCVVCYGFGAFLLYEAKYKPSNIKKPYDFVKMDFFRGSMMLFIGTVLLLTVFVKSCS